MQQVLARKGKIILEEIPPPACGANEVLIATHYSLISTGTEKTGISRSGQSLVTRAIKEPHNLKKVMKMAAERGILQTYRVVSGMLDFGMPLGYSVSGTVIEVGKNITERPSLSEAKPASARREREASGSAGAELKKLMRPGGATFIKKGDFVAAAGAGFANHAQVIAVPRLLVAKIPHGLDLKQAASVTLGAIAMHGIRQANVHLGETVAVIGLGLIGQLTCQMLSAAGCHVVPIDIDEGRVELAQRFAGTFATLPEQGCDATIITASTESNEPLKQAMEITRKRGTVVVVGDVGLKINRSPWYEKEIDLKISRSYGPGRYDPSYEEDGIDYPYAYVRWTENRNMEEYLNLLASGKVNFLNLNPLEFSFNEAQKAYSALNTKKPLAVLLRYETPSEQSQAKKIILRSQPVASDRIRIALIGAGAFAATTHLPNLAKLNNLFSLRAVVSKKGLTAKQYAAKYRAAYCTTDYEEVINDPEIDAVLIATRHDLHAPLILKALNAGKAVFVEKPLCLSRTELDEIKLFYSLHSSPLLFIGFNRRFSPYSMRIKELVHSRKNPLLITYRVNAGSLPPDHWTLGPHGGGRVIGEACHFFDLFNYLTDAKPLKITAHSTDKENFSATLTYDDGSICTLLYTSRGNRDLPKEYAEIYCDGRVILLNDYKELVVKGGTGDMDTFTQKKGHLEELEAFGQGLKEGIWPISLDDMLSATETSFIVNEYV